MTDESAKPTLRARLTTHKDGTTECTIYPEHASGEQRMAQWITAEEGSYTEIGGEGHTCPMQ